MGHLQLSEVPRALVTVAPYAVAVAPRTCERGMPGVYVTPCLREHVIRDAPTQGVVTNNVIHHLLKVGWESKEARLVELSRTLLHLLSYPVRSAYHSTQR